jgi:hypothetical protein
MRCSGLIGLLVAGVCLAAPTKSKAIGSSREDEPDGPPVVMPAGDADIALMRGLLYALEPAPTEIRVIAVEDLGLLGDTRALNPLAQLLMDPNPAVQTAALRAIASMRHPRAEEILSNVARHPTLPERLKLSAIDLVLFQNTDTAIGFLRQISRSPTFSFNLQNAAKKVLTDVPTARVEGNR